MFEYSIDSALVSCKFFSLYQSTNQSAICNMLKVGIIKIELIIHTVLK